MDYLLLNIVFCNVVLYIYTATYNDQQSLCMLRRMRNIWYSACLPLWSDSVLLWARLGRLYNWVFSIVRGSRGFTTPRSTDMNTEYTAPVYSRGRGHFQREKESMSVRIVCGQNTCVFHSCNARILQISKLDLTQLLLQ